MTPTDVSLAGAFLAGLVSFLSPCVLPLVPGYISMLSGIGMEQLRQGEVPRSGLFSSAIAFVAGFSVVFIAFGASASAVGAFLKQNRNLLAPVAGALILLFGLHLIGALIKLRVRIGVILGAILAGFGVAALFRQDPLFAGLRAMHFFSLSLIGFFGPAMARWLNRDVHLRSGLGQPGIGRGFLLGFAFAFGWSPCLGPILGSILALAAATGTIARGVLLLAVYCAGLAIPFLLTALGISRFMAFYKGFRQYLHAVELFSGTLLLFVGGLVFFNRLTWLAGRLAFLNAMVVWLENALTAGTRGGGFWLVTGLASLVVVTLSAIWFRKELLTMNGKKTVLVVMTVVALIVATYIANREIGVKASVSTKDAEQKATIANAPDVTFKDLDGKDVPLSQYKGKVVLVNFWATWCEPCQVEIPWLIEMQQKYSSKGFTILGVDVDDEGNNVVSAYTAKERFNVNGEKLPMNYPILRGNDAVADKFGGLLGYPTNFLVSRDGRIVKTFQGLHDYDEIKNAIEGQL